MIFIVRVIFEKIFQNDEKDLITTSASLNLNWTDSTLTWNISDFGNLKAVRLSIFNIWLPGIYFFRKLFRKNFEINSF